MSNIHNDTIIEGYVEKFHDLVTKKDWNKVKSLVFEMQAKDLEDLATTLVSSMFIGDWYEYTKFFEGKIANTKIERDGGGMEEGEEDVCEYCGGTGEVLGDERDSDGNWRRGVNVEKCICQIEE